MPLPLRIGLQNHSNNKNCRDVFSRVAITPHCNKGSEYLFPERNLHTHSTLSAPSTSCWYGSEMVAVEGIGPSSRSYNECNPLRAFVTWSTQKELRLL